MLPMAPAVAGTCDWDTDTGWVARENAKAGSAKWDDGAPVRSGGDFSRRVELKRIEGWLAQQVRSADKMLRFELLVDQKR